MKAMRLGPTQQADADAPRPSPTRHYCAGCKDTPQHNTKKKQATLVGGVLGATDDVTHL